MSVTKEYCVDLQRMSYTSVTVEATSKKHAREIAQRMIDTGKVYEAMWESDGEVRITQVEKTAEYE